MTTKNRQKQNICFFFKLMRSYINHLKLKKIRIKLRMHLKLNPSNIRLGDAFYSIITFFLNKIVFNNF